MLLVKSDEKKMFNTLQEATKALKADDAIYLWNLMLDRVGSNDSVSILFFLLVVCM